MTKKALQVIVSVFMDEKQPASLRLAAANDLLEQIVQHANSLILCRGGRLQPPYESGWQTLAQTKCGNSGLSVRQMI
jgi:hypothetical protein